MIQEPEDARRAMSCDPLTPPKGCRGSLATIRANKLNARQSDYLTTYAAHSANASSYSRRKTPEAVAGKFRHCRCSRRGMRFFIGPAICPRRWAIPATRCTSDVKTRSAQSSYRHSPAAGLPAGSLAYGGDLAPPAHLTTYRIRRTRGRRLAAHAARMDVLSRPMRSPPPPVEKQKKRQRIESVSARQQDISPPRQSI